jgi:putative ABC transport system permease protein
VRSVRWRKAVRDLGSHPIRSVLVVLSIAVGVFAVGTIAGADAMLQRNLTEGYEASRPSSATIFASPIDQALVDSVARMPEVADAEARRSVTVRLINPDGSYREMLLTAIPDFDNQQLDLVTPQSGGWPPKRGEVVMERSSLQLQGFEPGQVLTIQPADGKLHTVTVVGLSHEVGAAPAFYAGRVAGHVTPETLQELGYDDTFDELHLSVADPTLDEAGIRAVADEVANRIQRAGTPVFGTFVPVPHRHPANDLLQGFFLVLGFIGALSLIVSGFLVINTVSAILAQQTRQIGIMKAIGARNRQIAGLYLVLVLAYAVLALAVAIPLGALGAYGFASFTAGLANFDITNVFIAPQVIALEVAVGLVVPLAAAIVPIARGVRITVREALASTGIADRFGHGRFDRLLRDLRGLPRPTLLSIRNTFRRKGRLILTLAALSLGGAIFMSVFAVRASLVKTLDDVLAYFAYDVQVELATNERTTVLTTEAEAVPGVVAAEPWRFASAQVVRANGDEGKAVFAFGLPENAKSVRPTMQEGRWLVPGDGNALVATANIREDEPQLRVGDRVTLKIDNKDTAWTLVGIAQSPTRRPFLYAPDTALEEATSEVGRAGVLMIIGEPGMDRVQQDALAAAVRTRLEGAGVKVASTTTAGELRDAQETVFNVLVVFLSSMALLLGFVGGLGLTGTMTINVVERAREIGVLRAVGASDRSVLGIFLAEGILIGALSWALGVLVSIPVSKLLSDALGIVFVDRPLSYAYSVEGAMAWAVIVLLLAAVASLLPAWRASRLAVREILAYE